MVARARFHTFTGVPLNSLIERDDELEALEGLFAESDQGNGRIAVIRGRIGSGKSALLNAVADHVTRAGGLYLGAVAAQAEQDLPFGVMGQLAQEAASHKEGEFRAATIPDSPSQADRGTAIREFSSAFINLAENRTVVLGVDDLEFADLESMDCLQYLTRRIRNARMMLVICVPCILGEIDAKTYAQLFQQRHCRQITVPRISVRGAERVFAGMTALPLPVVQGFTPGVHALTGGNLAMVQALAEDCRHAVNAMPGQRPRLTEPVVDEFYKRAVLDCLHRWERDSAELAGAVAVLGGSASPQAVGRLTGRRAHLVTQPLAALSASGLLTPEGDDFRHPAARSAVLNELPPETRALFHRRAAEFLYEQGATPATVADHLVAADDTEPPWAAAVLSRAAEQALVTGKTPDAVRYLRLACTACTDRAERTALTSLLARAEWRIDPAVGVRHVDYLVAALRDGYLRGRHAFMPIRHLLWQGRVLEVRQILDDLSSRAGELDPDTAEGLRATQSWASSSYPPFGSHPEDRGRGRTLPQSADVQPLATVLRRRADHDSTTAAQQILQRERLDDVTLGPMVAALVALMYTSRTDEADACCASLLEEAEARRAPTWTALLSGIRAEIAVRCGDLGRAERYARTALSGLPLESWGVAIGRPLGTLVLALTSMGGYEEASRLLNLPVPNSMFKTRFGLNYLYARGNYYLAAGRPSAALGNFTACGDLMAQWDMDQPAVVPWRTGAAQACIHLGDRARAKKLVEEQIAMLAPDEFRTRGLSLRLLAETSALKQRPRLLAEAVITLRKSGDQLELARALAGLGAAHQSLGEWERARIRMRQASEFASECRADTLLRQLSSDLDLLDPQARMRQKTGRADLLSEAERKVAELAAQGLSNRQISDRLSITTSTVEQHLTRIYRKLKVRRRWDLPERLEPAQQR
jgi:DNA-binding CsgD family transcriptional regulator